MKTKIITVAFMVAMALTLCACGGSSKTDTVSGSAVSEKKLKGGFIQKTDFEGESVTQEMKKKGIEMPDDKLLESIKLNSIADLIIALDTGKIDFFEADESVAKYLLKSHPDYKYQEDDVLSERAYSMVLQKEKKTLRDKLNTAIRELKDNGELKKLTDKWIYSDIENKGKVEMPSIKGADTIKIGVTGDYPPMDYVDASGEPDGFNVALLAAIAKKLNVNVELVNVTTDAKAIALKTGKVDAVFEAIMYKDCMPTNYLITEDYFTVRGAMITKNVAFDDIFKALGHGVI